MEREGPGTWLLAPISPQTLFATALTFFQCSGFSFGPLLVSAAAGAGGGGGGGPPAGVGATGGCTNPFERGYEAPPAQRHQQTDLELSLCMGHESHHESWITQNLGFRQTFNKTFGCEIFFAVCGRKNIQNAHYNYAKSTEKK